MDIDKHDFLAEIVMRLVSLPGDPVEEVNSAVATVVAAHSIRLIMLARAHTADVLRLAERQRRRADDPSKVRQ
jgi:hypothetical protein